jgi:signal transduction histidine kinase
VLDNSNPVKSTKQARLRRILALYFGISWPILALVMLIALSGFFLLADIARDQDRAYEVNSQKLVEKSLETQAVSNHSLAVDYGVYTAAYKNVTLNFSQEWLLENYYTEIVSAIAVYRQTEGVKFSIPNTAHEAIDAEVKAAIARFGASYLNQAGVAEVSDSFVSLKGRLAVISTQLIRPEDQSSIKFPEAGRPVDHAVLVTIIGPKQIKSMTRAIGIEGMSYVNGVTPSAVNEDRITLIIRDKGGNQLGWFEWPNLRPGSTAFTKRLMPIGLGLLLVAISTIMVVRVSVSAQMRALKVAKLAAEAANKTKSSFLANVSHELRTPLNAIIGYSEIIEEDCGFAGITQTQEDARKVTNSAQHLLGLINDLLDHSKIEAGKMDLNPTKVALAPIFVSVGEALQRHLTKNRSILVLNCDPDIGDAMLDGMRFKQCLLNLVSNAAKFTIDGKITVSARSLDLEGTAFVRVTVKDTGIGMSPETVAKLFAPFVQADNETATRFGGTGLGLVITRALVEAMGGSVNVESVEGQGSTFTLLVPRGIEWAETKVPAHQDQAIAA